STTSITPSPTPSPKASTRASNPSKQPLAASGALPITALASSFFAANSILLLFCLQPLATRQPEEPRHCIAQRVPVETVYGRGQIESRKPCFTESDAD